MSLVLRAVALDEEPMSQPLIGRFDERGGTLGRSDDATLTLPDAERLISRIQAQILHRDEHYWLENLSTASAVLHNGRPLSTGMRIILSEGDEIRIGGYALQAAFEDEESSATILRGRTVVPPVRSSPGLLQRTTKPPAVRIAEASEPQRELTGEFRAVERTTPASDVPDSLWDGFLQGAGIEGSSLPSAPTPQLMRSIGEMLKIAVGGLQRLVTLRARAKSEMQSEMTIIERRDNNPLKFSPDEEVALQNLLLPPTRGFLGGPAAVRDAVLDLESHEVGMTAGMREVLKLVLDRLDPENLKNQAARRSIFDYLFPARARARLWDTYVSQYGSLREETQDEFQRLFGAAFREAYEAHVRNNDISGDTTGSVAGSGRLKAQMPKRR